MPRLKTKRRDERDDGLWPVAFSQVRAIVSFESRVTQRKLPWFSSMDRDDLKQEAWIVAFRVREKYRRRKGASFRTFLLRCVRNRLADILSKEWTQRHIPLVALDEARDVAMTESDENDPQWNELASLLGLQHEDRRTRWAFDLIRLGQGVNPAVADSEDVHDIVVGSLALKRRVAEVMGCPA